MTIYLVTGGAGFIGSHLVATLLQQGAAVRVLDNFSTGRRSNLTHLSGAEVIEGDVRHRDTVRTAMRQVDYVLHLAAQVSVPRSMDDPALNHAVNVDGTLNVLEAAREQSVKRVVLSSSCAVYGDNADLPLTEASSPKPLSPYAASKLIGEVYCQTYARAFGVPTVCLRYFNIYGPRQDPASEYAAVIPKFIQRMQNGQAPIVYGDGTQSRDFVYVGDVVRANLGVCERAEAIGRVYNIATGRGLSLLDLIDALNELLHTDYVPDFQAPRAGDIKHSLGSGELIAAELGFRPGVPLGDGLQHILAFQRAAV
jgi:nucleoside-diphosphate-sugar epimerase